MPALSTWNLDPTRILTRRELTTVLADLSARAARYANSQRNLIVVRLACCCGLRVSEIAGLQLDDVVADVQRPHLRLRRQITKGKRARCVPMWWDGATLADIVAWKARRIADGARAPTRSSVRCRPIGAASHFKEQRCEDGFCRRARCSVWLDCERSPSTMGGILL